jgi:hypothetical protein
VDGDERKSLRDTDPLKWAEDLARRVAEIIKENPNADPDTVRHTLILLELSPVERLERALLKGGARERIKRRLQEQIQALHALPKELRPKLQ